MVRLSLPLVGLSVLLAPLAASGENVPDAFSVEWQGKPPCETCDQRSALSTSRSTGPLEWPITVGAQPFMMTRDILSMVRVRGRAYISNTLLDARNDVKNPALETAIRKGEHAIRTTVRDVQERRGRFARVLPHLQDIVPVA
jgi:hypothetical protein